MNILIVETVWMGGARYKFLEKTLLNTFSILPTLQAREYAAVTPKHHNISVINERYKTINYNNTYDIVLINFVTSTAPRAYVIADNFRKKGVTVVLSGFHASGLPEEAQQHADSILIGRNELIWPTVLEDFKQKKLQPLYYAPFYKASMTLPPTNVTLPGFVLTAAIEATRGCPYHCEFCPEANINGGSSFYKRPIAEVVSEIKSIRQKTLMFYDTSLTIDASYTKELFTQMRGLKKRFFCNGNVDVLAHDQEIVDLSKDAGCVAWLIGFESICPTTLQKIGKITNRVDDYELAVHNIHDKHMVVIGDFMFGFDTDTPDVFKQTLFSIKTLNIDVADFSILTPFPGTPLFKNLDHENRILTKEWKYYNMGHVVFKPKQMTPEQLLRGVQQMYSEFYRFPYSIKRIMQNLPRGLYPFFVVFARNLVAMMNVRRLYSLEKMNQ
jgi:radical SAM superfamily enzyme YgiQ (UPF0313 family)